VIEDTDKKLAEISARLAKEFPKYAELASLKPRGVGGRI
jgi:hypothetical protein